MKELLRRLRRVEAEGGRQQRVAEDATLQALTTLPTLELFRRYRVALRRGRRSKVTPSVESLRDLPGDVVFRMYRDALGRR